jgi:heme A synthase
MDLVKTISTILGVVCIIIGILLIPLSIWFLQPAIKDKDKVFLIIGILILILAAACFIGAFSMFTTGIIVQFLFPLQR